MRRRKSEFQELSCPICYESYSSSHNRPTIICCNNHSICAQCVANLQSFKCPFCRAAISLDNAAANHSIINPSLQHPASIRQQVRNLPVYRPQYQEIQISCLDRLKYFIWDLQDPILLIQFLQIPIAIFDLIFAISDNDPNCMDKQYELPLTARQFFLVMCIWGLSLVISFFLLLIIKKLERNRTSWECTNNFFFFLLLVKIAFSVIGEMVVFTDIIKSCCSGGVYKYCLLQTLFYTIVLPIHAFIYRFYIRGEI